MIGYSRCSYVNEHLVAPAGPVVEPGLRLFAGLSLREGLKCTDLGSFVAVLNAFPSHCRQICTLLYPKSVSDSRTMRLTPAYAF